MDTGEFRLTRFSHGGGCGCKIAPGVLREVIGPASAGPVFKELLVGNETSDDAAVYDLGNGRTLIATVDFFMPIVDDAFTFGRIAAANALSDVYAMGGTPAMALAVLGWPVEKLPAALAGEVMRGARELCASAGIPVAGGHTIDSPEPFFGLSVNGFGTVKGLKRNCDAKEGDLLFLTKPLGLGIITTAGKREQASRPAMDKAIALMTRLNDAGPLLGAMNGVHAMTDVTGFGFLGHLLEICGGSGLNARVFKDRIPVIPEAEEYAAKMIYPDSTFRNWKSFSERVSGIDPQRLLLLCDPQTSGGLLFSADPADEARISALLAEKQWHHHVIGKMESGNGSIILE